MRAMYWHARANTIGLKFMLSQLHLSLFIGSTQRVKLYSYLVRQPVRQKEALAIASSRVQRNWEKEPSLRRELAPFGVSLPSLSKLGNAL